MINYFHLSLTGYNAVEMNASDDRSPEIFRNQLEAATQMQAVLGKSPKPNCLILDEIDGAPAVSVSVLMKWLYKFQWDYHRCFLFLSYLGFH